MFVLARGEVTIAGVIGSQGALPQAPGSIAPLHLELIERAVNPTDGRLTDGLGSGIDDFQKTLRIQLTSGAGADQQHTRSGQS